MINTETEELQMLPWGNPDYINNPYPWYRKARQEFPVFQDTDGTYVITRYEDVVKFGKLQSLSIVDPAWVPKGPWAALSSTVLSIDPPLHTQIRRRSNKWFTPKLVNKWVEAAEAFVNARLDEISSGETFDANMLLGVGPSHAAMCNALQLPANDFEPVIMSMHKTMAALSATAGDTENAAATAAFDYMFSRVEEMLHYKRENPGDGMVDALIELSDKGEITQEELIQTVVLFWGSGGHNPSYIVSSGIAHFAQNPEVYQIYRQHPEHRSAIINELFRLYPPELSFARYATEELIIGDKTIVPGERVRFMLDSANRDESVFTDPDKLDIMRPPETAQNVSFGLGPHACAGQIISRALADTIFGALSKRVANFTITATPVMDNSDRSRAYVNLPIAVEKIA